MLLEKAKAAATFALAAAIVTVITVASSLNLDRMSAWASDTLTALDSASRGATKVLVGNELGPMWFPVVRRSRLV